MVSVSRAIRVEEAFEDGVIVARRDDDVPPVKPACNDAACAASIEEEGDRRHLAAPRMINTEEVYSSIGFAYLLRKLPIAMNVLSSVFYPGYLERGKSAEN